MFKDIALIDTDEENVKFVTSSFIITGYYVYSLISLKFNQFAAFLVSYNKTNFVYVSLINSAYKIINLLKEKYFEKTSDLIALSEKEGQNAYSLKHSILLSRNLEIINEYLDYLKQEEFTREDYLIINRNYKDKTDYDTYIKVFLTKFDNLKPSYFSLVLIIKTLL